MKAALLVVSLLAASVLGKVYFKETFSDDKWEKRWVYSRIKSDQGRFKWTAGRYFADAELNKGIQTAEDAKYYSMTSKFSEPFNNDGKTLVFQFEVKHEQHLDCGGGYLKILPYKQDQARYDGDSKYYIMFGPDICGNTKKVHIIFHYKGKNLDWKKEPKGEFDQYTHQYRLSVFPNATYEFHVDNQYKDGGRLEDDWDFLKPKTISDPNDRKPYDWSDEPEIDDPTDIKPADWDVEPETIPDAHARKPSDWDEEEDGKWEPAQIPNPKYRGIWRPRRVPNPKYKGEWKPRQMPNPEYIPDDKLAVYEDLGTIGFDLWQMRGGSLFDNIFVGDDVDEAMQFTLDTYERTRDTERRAKADADENDRRHAEANRPKRPRRHRDDDYDDEDEDEDEDEDDENDEL